MVDDLTQYLSGRHLTRPFSVHCRASGDLNRKTYLYFTHSCPLSFPPDWASGQPGSTSTHDSDEHCIEMNLGGSHEGWNDDECHHEQRFVCQKPAMTTSEPDYVTGTVDTIVG